MLHGQEPPQRAPKPQKVKPGSLLGPLWVLLVGEFLGVGPTSVLLVVPGRALSVFSSRVFSAGGPTISPPRILLWENEWHLIQLHLVGN